MFGCKRVLLKMFRKTIQFFLSGAMGNQIKPGKKKLQQESTLIEVTKIRDSFNMIQDSFAGK